MITRMGETEWPSHSLLIHTPLKSEGGLPICSKGRVGLSRPIHCQLTGCIAPQEGDR